MNEKYAAQRGELLKQLDGMRLEFDALKRVATLVLDRPPLNVVSYTARSQIAALFDELGRDPEVGVVVVRGANGVFTSGGDVRGFFDVPRDGMSHLAWNIAAPERCPKPVIAALEKYAFGVGWELALACDFRIATKDTLVALPEITIGQMPGSGGSQRVLRMVGMTRAKDMVMLGRRLSAAEAREWGLLTEVVEDGAALDKAIAGYAERLNALSPLALSTVKRVLNQGEDASLEASFDLEGHAYEKLRDSHDYKEGAQAFFEKRKPKYTGK
ncbi:MAG: enoyl-CoA hydratase/isomerase family protein [Betaproteobacteria bacterium]|nr:enoyl-CoA hydratase/isomerase family protein [Betaproteobacteria bacterium]